MSFDKAPSSERFRISPFKFTPTATTGQQQAVSVFPKRKQKQIIIVINTGLTQAHLKLRAVNQEDARIPGFAGIQISEEKIRIQSLQSKKVDFFRSL